MRVGRALRRGLGAVAVATALFALVVVVDGWVAFGQRATGPRRARMERSAQWADGVFENFEPLYNDYLGSLTTFADRSDHAQPATPVQVVRGGGASSLAPPQSGLRITWFGHSSVLVEIDGRRLLTDPVWGLRASPNSWLGPRRWYPPPTELEALLPLDAVLISHDHYDHLDHPTITLLKDRVRRFVVPLGVGAHLEYWGVPASNIVELDWWQSEDVEGVEVVCVPSRHASGRQLLDQNATLWAGYVLAGPRHRVYFSGDTGLFDGLREIGARYGPFDLTMIEVGAYNRAWPDWHIGPEQAVLAHGWLEGELFMPVHWGLFDLATHGWTEPVERVAAAARTASVAWVAPRPGESFEPASHRPRRRWWPEIPWQDAQQHPVVSTKVTTRTATAWVAP